MVSYWTAFLKANYRAEYMAAVLTSVRDDKDKAAVYLGECRRMGIRVLPPDVNDSVRNFAPVGDDIRFGLGGIRNVGVNVVDAIVAARKDKGGFTDFSDFLRKVDAVVCNKKVIESLIKAGAFDSLGHSRKGLLLVHADAIDAVMSTKKAASMGQFDLFGSMDGTGGSELDAVFDVKVPAEEWDPKHRLAVEREMLGLYVSGHPLDGIEQALAAKADTPISAILEGDVAEGAQVTVGGILAGVNRRVNKNGEPWASAQIEDLAGGIEVLFFPRCYQVVGVDVAEDAIVLVKAPGEQARRPGLADRERPRRAGDRRAGGGGAAVQGQPAHGAVHTGAGGEAQGGADAPPRPVGGAPATWSTAAAPLRCAWPTRCGSRTAPR